MYMESRMSSGTVIELMQRNFRLISKVFTLKKHRISKMKRSLIIYLPSTSKCSIRVYTYYLSVTSQNCKQNTLNISINIKTNTTENLLTHSLTGHTGFESLIPRQLFSSMQSYLRPIFFSTLSVYITSILKALTSRTVLSSHRRMGLPKSLFPNTCLKELTKFISCSSKPSGFELHLACLTSGVLLDYVFVSTSRYPHPVFLRKALLKPYYFYSIVGKLF